MLKKHAKMFNIGIDKHSTIPHLMRNPGSISFQIEKEKEWIPNRVGDDKLLGSSIKDFKDDNRRTFEDERYCGFLNN